MYRPACLEYLARRPWLTVWLLFLAVVLVLLAATGQIYTQGNKYPTIFEYGTLASVLAIWGIAKYCFKCDLTDEYILAFIFAVQWEFLTKPYWTYQPGKFNIMVWESQWGGLPLIALTGWAPTLSLALLVSEWLGRTWFHKTGAQLLCDPRILLCDALAIQLFGSAAEWTLGICYKCWTYNLPFGLGRSPLGLGWEVHIGYMIVFFWYGTTMRVWRMKLEGRLDAR